MDDNLDGKKEVLTILCYIFGYTTYMPTFVYTHYVQFQMSKFTSTNKSCACKITPRVLYPPFNITHTAAYIGKLTQPAGKFRAFRKCGITILVIIRKC